MPRYFVIRQETRNLTVAAELNQEIRRGNLRQGWGGRGMDLGQEAERYSVAYAQAWDKPEAEGRARFAILRPMLEIVQGDRIVVPKQPRWDRFLILTAVPLDDRVYRFDTAARPAGNPLDDDFRHVIHIDPRSIVEFGYRDNMDTLAVNMRGWRSAVNNVLNPGFQAGIERLLQGGGAHPDPIAPAETVRRAAMADAVLAVLGRVRTVGPEILEKVVEAIFEGQGFETIARNRYNRADGDIDRVFHWSAAGHPLLESISPDLDLGVTLNVQVKQKTEVDQDDVKGVQQLVDMKSGAVNEYSILVSTADEFTVKCKELAQSEKVILVNGKAFAELYLKFS